MLSAGTAITLSHSKHIEIRKGCRSMEARRARRLRRLKRTLPYMTASATLLLALCIALQFASLIPLRRFSPFMGSSAKQPTSMVAKATATATGTDTPIPFSTPLPEVLPAPVGSLTCLSTTMLPTTPIPTPKASVTPTPAAPAASSVLGFHPCLYSGPDSSSTSSMLQFYLYIPRNYSPILSPCAAVARRRRTHPGKADAQPKYRQAAQSGIRGCLGAWVPSGRAKYTGSLAEFCGGSPVD